MHEIEPYYRWRDEYIADEDSKSPYYKQVYNELKYSQKIYNYYIHPQWDSIGSQTLYVKVLYIDYDQGYGIIELIGEWNDCLYNDVMFLKRELADYMIRAGISKFILMCDNILNFHSSDDSYYEEWCDDIADEGGWIVMINVQEHVLIEMARKESPICSS